MSVRSRIFRQRRLPSTRPLAALVAALFANGEQGLWYDIEGFRDAWNSVGPELVTNGDFSAGTAGWSLGAGLSVSGGALVAATTSNQTATQAIPSVVAGKWYLVSLTVVSYTSGNLRVNVGGSLVSVPAPALLGQRQVLVQAGSIDTYFRVYAGDVSVGGTSTIDNVSVKEWLGLTSCALYQDSSGTLPVYMPGQGQVDPPVGLVLDKRLGLARGTNRFNDTYVVFSGESTRVSPGVYRCYSSAGAYNLVSFGGSLTIGKWYELTFTVDSVATTGLGIALDGAVTTQNALNVTTTGVKTCIFLAAGGYIGVKRNSGAVDYQISGVSIREVPGNHAYQASTPSRATLSARYNVLESSEKFDSAYWGFTTAFGVSKTAETPDPIGGSDAWKITSVTANAAVSKVYGTGMKNPVYTLWVKAGTWNPSVLVRNQTTAVSLVSAPIASADFTNSYGKFTNLDLGNGWRRMRIEITSGIALTDTVTIYLGSTGAIPAGQYYYLWRVDMREAGDGVGLPEYQRVVDANTYDTTGFPLYLKADGGDDWLVTGNIDFSGTDKIFLCAAVRKNSDAAQGMLFEQSNDYTGGTASRFALLAPAVGATYGARVAAGAAISNVNTLNVAAPNSSVLSLVADLASGIPAASRLTLRRNGSTADQQLNRSAITATPFDNQPIYIFRRAGTSLPFGGRVYGWIIRAGAITDSQVAAVERYLNQRGKVY